MREPTCREVVEIVTEYLEGTLPDDRREALEQHLEGCSGCRAYIEQMRGVVAAGGRIAPEELTPEQREQLIRVFRGAVRDRQA